MWGHIPAWLFLLRGRSDTGVNGSDVVLSKALEMWGRQVVKPRGS